MTSRRCCKFAPRNRQRWLMSIRSFGYLHLLRHLLLTVSSKSSFHGEIVPHEGAQAEMRFDATASERKANVESDIVTQTTTKKSCLRAIFKQHRLFHGSRFSRAKSALKGGTRKLIKLIHFQCDRFHNRLHNTKKRGSILWMNEKCSAGRSLSWICLNVKAEAASCANKSGFGNEKLFFSRAASSEMQICDFWRFFELSV